MFKPAKQKHYSEEHQAYQGKFCWVKKEGDDYVAQHWWVNCRDFLADAIAIKLSGKANGIYRFHVEPEEFRVTNLLAFTASTKHITYLKDNLKLLHKIEEDNDLPKTKIIFEDDTVVVLKFNRFWRKHPSLVSLYSYLIKVFSYSKDGKFDETTGSEEQYYCSTEHTLEKLLKNLSKLDYPKFNTNFTDIAHFHNNTGFVSTWRKNSTHTLAQQLRAL